MDVVMLEEIREIVNMQISSATARRKVFTANGTFTIPEGVETIFVTACSAGNDGTAGQYIIQHGYSAGNGGSAGEFIGRYPLRVTAEKILQFTVGTGDTILSLNDVPVLTLKKGCGAKGGTGGTYISKNPIDADEPMNPYIGIKGKAGVNGYTYSERGYAGRGICAPGGGGGYATGSGGTQCETVGESAGGFGNGGGGGGVNQKDETKMSGGTGSPGIVIIEW